MNTEDVQKMIELITAQAKRIKELENEIATLCARLDNDVRTTEIPRKHTEQSQWAASTRNG